MLGLKINLNLFIACLGPFSFRAVPPDFPAVDGTLMGQRYRTLPLPTELSD